jgi:hypothetical protein
MKSLMIDIYKLFSFLRLRRNSELQISTIEHGKELKLNYVRVDLTQYLSTLGNVPV